MNGDSERNQKIKQCIGKLDGASSELCGLQIRVSAISSQVEATTSEVKRAVRTLERLVEVARSIEKMPVLDSDDYKSAIHKSLDLQKQVSYEIGRLEVFELLLRCLGEKKMEDGIRLALGWLRNRDTTLFKDFLDYFETRHRGLVNDANMERDRQRGFLENKIRNELHAELRQEREKLKRERSALERDRDVFERDCRKWEQKSGTGKEIIGGNDIASNSNSGIGQNITPMDGFVGQMLATTSDKKKSKPFVGCALSLIVVILLIILMVGIVRYVFFSPTTEKETRGFDIEMFDVSNQVVKVHGEEPKSDPSQTVKSKIATTNITNVSTADNQPSNQLKTVTCTNIVHDSDSAKPSKTKGSLKDSKGVRK